MPFFQIQNPDFTLAEDVLQQPSWIFLDPQADKSPLQILGLRQWSFLASLSGIIELVEGVARFANRGLLYRQFTALPRDQ